jgi:hypothetical protein
VWPLQAAAFHGQDDLAACPGALTKQRSSRAKGFPAGATDSNTDIWNEQQQQQQQQRDVLSGNTAAERVATLAVAYYK